ncbi:hypothetical protein PBI_SHIFA_17 [Mycobacterium phage Shifa]|uniref:Uncharacterized protein n=2 Tax=Bixzunavirus hyro TaxID=2006136 RepID=A0A7M1CT01_9CAUD|nr:hypothetical protein HYRO_18 [Mycobacterium phage HyRo]ALA48212.1 hypothetical protein HYRO_18 [Mycobacterium phage HyRo]QOP66893.1 hypothetical protein PBI_SHIFA_17 [Mycobacterium phage Shifa]
MTDCVFCPGNWDNLDILDSVPRGFIDTLKGD